MNEVIIHSSIAFATFSLASTRRHFVANQKNKKEMNKAGETFCGYSKVYDDHFKLITHLIFILHDIYSFCDNQFLSENDYYKMGREC